MMDAYARTLVALVSILAVIAAAAALRATYLVTMPLAFAFFVSVLIWPVHAGLRRRLPERLGWLGIVAAMLVIVAALGAFAGGAWAMLWTVAGDAGRGAVEQAQERWQAMTAWLAERGVPVPDEGGELFAGLVDWARSAVVSLTGIAAALVLIVFFSLLMLVEAHHWRDKSRLALPRAGAHGVVDAVGAITVQVRTFLLVQGLVSFVTALVTGGWLWLMGVPFVPLWMLLTFLVDFVPNVGPTLAGIVISLAALLTLGWERSLVTALGLLVIQQFFGNFVDPVLKGRRMAISPLVVLLSVVFWAWVWGPAGAVIAVPMTATLIIACAHVPALAPIALLLSRTADREKLAEQTHGR